MALSDSEYRGGIVEVSNVKFYEVTTFSSKACQLSLSQVRVILHFSWRKYTLTEMLPTDWSSWYH